MGNYCSSGQSKKDKDNASDKSEESPSYQIAKDKNRKSNEAPLASAEPLSEPSSAATVGTNGFTNTETTTITATTKFNSKPLSNLQSINLTAGDSATNSPLAISAPCDLAVSQQKLPQNLTPLYGKPTNRRTDKDRKIVLYILAADDGCQTEKSILGEVYNNLNQKCMSKGFELHIADLHVNNNNKENTFDITTWLNGPLEAQAGHDLAVNCLAEISRHSSDSYLIPILFLSSTLGRSLLPLTIEKQDFAIVLATADDAGKQLLEKWYIQDDKSQPICYRLRSSSAELSSEENCEKQLSALLNTIVDVFSKELRDSYLTTDVEQEINNTVMINQELAKRCIWIQNSVQLPKITEKSTSLEIEVNRRIVNLHNDLKSQLSEKHIIKIPPSIGSQQAQFASILETCLSAEIDIILEEHINKYQIPYCTYGVDRRLLCEIEEVNRHSRVLNQNCAVFEIIPEIKKYLDDTSKKPLVIYGKSGCGKSVLSATIARTVHTWTPEYNFLLRYANLTQSSRDLVSVIGSITDQLSVLIHGVPSKCSHDLQSYSEELKSLVEHTKQQTIILIDSIDDLIDLNDFDWLPTSLLDNVKIILTVTSKATNLTQLNADEDVILNKLKSHIGDDSKLLHLSSFKKFQWELSFSRGDFSGVSHLADIWEKCEEKSPVQAKILSWLAWVGVIDIKNTSIEYLCEEVFNFLEKQFTNVIAKFIIAIFTASRDGLLETEIVSLLTSTNLIQGSATKLWANFSWLMGPLLLHNKNITIMDKIILIVANKHYSEDISKAHQILYDFYNAQPHFYVDKKGKDKFYNNRKFIELPYHSYKLNQTNFNESPYITDISWIENKLIATGCVHLLNDIYLILNHFKDNFTKINVEHKYDHLIVLRKFLELNFKALNYDAQQLYSCFMHYIKTTDNSEFRENDKFLNPVLDTWLKEMQSTTSIYYEKLVIVNNDDNVNHGYDTIMNLERPGFFVISLNTDREEICVFDASTSTKIRTLKGVPQPTSLCPVGDYGVAVLCKREIRVIDLDDGKFKVTLKGVMNQKMPYFGLHDPKHLICLSRNRMYVNLMNLESGDCVTTFKAGEDRFLNSLLVSGDGRILVCGDETQKPFPLLVWHLSQRKLLYDLRIPHHDFQTALSAITHEGSYVCVVAKELSEPTPNFIVVYDLQSGTLFKKWKPSCNTVSLAISQTNTCVIAGLEDARILIWDLVTGNCRCTLIGHNAPVTLLKLDPSGKYLLSSDKEGRDMSVRVWELSTGKSITVYTPSEKITAGEILFGGKYVVLAVENNPNLVTLKLYGERFNSPNNEANEVYGKVENHGKIFDLKE